MEMEAEEGANKQQDAYAKDGSVDLRGRPAVAARTGRWKACAFLVGNKQSSLLVSLPGRFDHHGWAS